MKIIRKNETKSYKNIDQCIAIEYPLGDKDINGAVIKLNGRYPDKGKTVNTNVKEMTYVIKGEGKIVVNNKEEKLKEGDLILIYPMEEYFWERNLEMFIPCTPAWTPQQHKIIISR